MIITMEHPDMYEKLVDSVEAHGGSGRNCGGIQYPPKKKPVDIHKKSPAMIRLVGVLALAPPLAPNTVILYRRCQLGLRKFFSSIFSSTSPE